MLVITRKTGERIQINDNIFIYVVNITQNTVKLSFDAPKEVKIIRSELLYRTKEVNKKKTKNMV